MSNYKSKWTQLMLFALHVASGGDPTNTTKFRKVKVKRKKVRGRKCQTTEKR